jgi:hypothetical protein
VKLEVIGATKAEAAEASDSEVEVVGESKRGTHTSPILITSGSDNEPHKKRKSWPADYYAVDIVSCFEACEPPKGKKVDDKKVAEIFHRHFDAKFPKSTFYAHRTRWKIAPQAARDKALAGGQTPAGLWVKFMQENPAADAKKKAAMKRINRQGGGEDGVEVISSD